MNRNQRKEHYKLFKSGKFLMTAMLFTLVAGPMMQMVGPIVNAVVMASTPTGLQDPSNPNSVTWGINNGGFPV